MRDLRNVELTDSVFFFFPVSLLAMVCSLNHRWTMIFQDMVQIFRWDGLRGV